MANSLLRYPLVVLARIIFLMSGILALYREAYALYSGKPPTASAFWECVWIAFILSAVIAWWQEHAAVSSEGKRREGAEEALNDQAPKLYLEYSPVGLRHTTNSGLSVGNSGKTDAIRVRLDCDLTKHYRLDFEDMPIQRIGSADREMVKVRTQELHGDGRWLGIGGTLGMQIEGCFARMHSAELDERIPVTIKCLDHKGTEHIKPWVIRCGGDWGAARRIWCEPT